MSKLKLNLDEIKVESFEVMDSVKKSGTILAQETGDGCLTPLDLCDPTSVGTTCPATGCGESCPCTIDEPGCPTLITCNTCMGATCEYPCSKPVYTYCVPECLA
ncbi:MAG: hypothetical protein WCZ90_12515 [Melioribacteraceae bacterium]